MITKSSRTFGLLFCLSFVAAPVCPAQEPQKQIRSALTQLEGGLPALPLSEEERRQRAAEIQAVKDALDAGHLYAALYRLHPVYVELQAQQYVGARAGLKKGPTQAFEQEWRRLGRELDRDRRLFKPAASSRAPAAVQALAESAFSQVAPYHQSGRLYGLNTEIQYGLYYLGRAPGSLSFARLCQASSPDRTQPQLRLRSLQAELSRLEADVLKAYRQADLRTQEPSYIRVNVTLKVATELDRAAMYAGALHKLLEAVMFFASITTQSGDVRDLARLQEEATEAKAKLAGRADHSIGQMYLEIAEGALRQAASGARKEENLKLATIVFGSVLPRYFHILSEGKS